MQQDGVAFNGCWRSHCKQLKVCEDKCEYYTQHGHQYQCMFLERRLTVARIKKNSKAEKQILEIIKQEKQPTLWQQLNYSMKKNQVQDDKGEIL